MSKRPLPGDFKKCPSVTREGKFFFYSANLRAWIVENPLSGDWFIDTEKTRLPLVFKTALAGMRFAFDCPTALTEKKGEGK